MKSSIKVDYASIYGDNLQDKQPVIRVEAFESDDPRDTLLCSIFKEESKLSLWKRASTNTFIIFEKNRFEQVVEIASDCFQTLLALYPSAQNMNMVTGSEEMYFEIPVSDPPLKRSKPLDRYRLNALDDRNVIRELVANFKEFIEAEGEIRWVNIPDNSNGFRQLLDDRKIKWEPNEHYTRVDASTDLYTLGVLAERARPKSN